jgi:hypothetical protein
MKAEVQSPKAGEETNYQVPNRQRGRVLGRGGVRKKSIEGVQFK